MDYSQPFSVLNESLRPRVTTSQQLHSSLSRVEDRQLGSLRNRSSYRPTVLPAEDPEEEAETEDPEEDELGEGDASDPSLRDEAADEDSSSGSEGKDVPGELASEGAGEPAALACNGETRLQGGYLDVSLPDLINSGRPLGRRRTLGHVSDTLKEVRREVELSRRRSIKLKKQVDKLQESREGPGWSQHRERVTEEVLSILRLLSPLTEAEPSQQAGENQLDAALTQLQSVARKLAISHTKQDKHGRGSGAEDSALLQQALRDRDEAMEKKKAMEAELLRSKTEMMMLNNQLLEAVQKRLEVSLELEACKEDIQVILHQQLQIQQQAEQAQRKSSRMGILRRNKAPVQRPSNFPLPQSAAAPPAGNSNQVFLGRSSPSPGATPNGTVRGNWMDKLKRGGKGGRDQDATGHQGSQWGGKDDGFQVVSLD